MWTKSQTALLIIILLFFITITTCSLLGCSLQIPSFHSSRPATTKWAGKSKVNVLLAINTNKERGHINNLLANPAMLTNHSQWASTLLRHALQACTGPVNQPMTHSKYWYPETILKTTCAREDILPQYHLKPYFHVTNVNSYEWLISITISKQKEGIFSADRLHRSNNRVYSWDTLATMSTYSQIPKCILDAIQFGCVNQPNVTLLDQNTSMMDGFGHGRLEHKVLEALL